MCFCGDSFAYFCQVLQLIRISRRVLYELFDVFMFHVENASFVTTVLK